MVFPLSSCVESDSIRFRYTMEMKRKKSLYTFHYHTLFSTHSLSPPHKVSSIKLEHLRTNLRSVKRNSTHLSIKLVCDIEESIWFRCKIKYYCRKIKRLCFSVFRVLFFFFLNRSRCNRLTCIFVVIVSFVIFPIFRSGDCIIALSSQ